MKDLQAIAALYVQIDNSLESLRKASGAHIGAHDRITDRQRINDQAYFVLAWGQIESEIDAACREAIRRGKAHREWRHRRAWSLYNPDDRRLSGLSFEDRLALVIEKGSEYWRRTVQHYAIRNQIAHGDLRLERIDVSSVVEDFFLIQSSLTR